jgi:hypothetical protein
MSRLRFVTIATAVGLAFAIVTPGVFGQGRRRARPPAICGNPTVACKSSVTFHPYDLPYKLPENAVIWESEFFYAVLLKSMKADYDDCDRFIPETERLAAQTLFPDHKVFTSRCSDIEELFYTNLSEKHRIMAVYAGRTLAEAKLFLETVKATGKFPGASLRRTRTGFNGT